MQNYFEESKVTFYFLNIYKDKMDLKKIISTVKLKNPS